MENAPNKKNANILELNDEDSINSDLFENQDKEKLNFSEEEDNDYQENSSILLENIYSILEKLSTNFKNDQKLLFKILKEINISINLIINEFSSFSKKKIDMNDDENDVNNFFLTAEKDIYENDDEENKNMKLDTNSKVVFLLKIELLNRRIASLNEEIKNLKTILFKSNNKLNKDKNDNYYKFFMKKFKEIKDRKKCDDFKYLIFIENQKKKIMDLEEKLKIKNNENLPKDTLKSIRCFPNFVQYDFKEDINPKTIPLYQYIQQKKEKEKKTEKTKKSPKSKKNIFHSNKNKIKLQIQPLTNTFNKTYSCNKNKYKTKEITLNDNIKTDDYRNNYNYNMINITDIKNNLKMFSNKGKYNSNRYINFKKFYDLDIDKNINYKYKTLSYEDKSRNNKYKVKKDLIKEIKAFNPKNIINNKKEFFISHPTLDIAGVAKGKEQVYIGLPKKLLRLNKGGNFKSTMMVFPSSLNETMVNLEKLRSNKLHVDINKKENEKE